MNVKSHSVHHHLSSNDKDKPWLMLIHGLFGSLDNLAVIRRELQNDFNVLSVDLPDHGKSIYTEQFGFDTYANYMFDLLDDLGIEKIQVLGHSLGGKVAMCMALTQPNRITKLVLADIAPVKYEPRHQSVLSGLNNVDLNNTLDRNHANEQMVEHIVEPGVRQFLLKSLYQEDGKWSWRFNLALLERDYPRLSGAIESEKPFTKPVLFIKGGNSDYLLAKHQSPIAKLFPNSQAKIIQNTGHWLHSEKPSIFNRLARSFLLSAE